jgi:hypothetical protein
MSRAQREEKIRRGLIDPAGEKSELYGVWQTEPWLPEAAQNVSERDNSVVFCDFYCCSFIVLMIFVSSGYRSEERARSRGCVGCRPHSARLCSLASSSLEAACKSLVSISLMR